VVNLSCKKNLKFEKIIGDPVYGSVGVTKEELNIIETPIFQRLRHIKQLGTSFFVYPSATHSRFSHSIGTMFMMGKFAQRLLEIDYITDYDEIEKLRFSALLHDLGHYPYSHCLERPIQKHSPEKKGSHENLSVEFILNTSIKDKIAENYDPKEITSIISKENYKNPLYSVLLSSDFDVDRADYLIRDAYATGVSYGFVDIDRLIGTLTIDKDKHLAVENKGKQALENFLISRYHMYQTVYYHKTVVGFDLMLQRVYEELMVQKKAYGYEQICKLSADEGELCDFNDNYVWKLLVENKGDSSFVGTLINMLRERKRLKKVKDLTGVSISGREHPGNNQRKLIDLPTQRAGLSKASKVPEEWIFYSSPKPLQILSNPLDETAIRVMSKDGTSTPIAEDSSSIIHNLYDSWFFYDRIYTNERNELQLMNGLREWFGI